MTDPVLAVALLVAALSSRRCPLAAAGPPRGPARTRVARAGRVGLGRRPGPRRGGHAPGAAGVAARARPRRPRGRRGRRRLPGRDRLGGPRPRSRRAAGRRSAAGLDRQGLGVPPRGRCDQRGAPAVPRRRHRAGPGRAGRAARPARAARRAGVGAAVPRGGATPTSSSRRTSTRWRSWPAAPSPGAHRAGRWPSGRAC